MAHAIFSASEDVAMMGCEPAMQSECFTHRRYVFSPSFSTLLTLDCGPWHPVQLESQSLKVVLFFYLNHVWQPKVQTGSSQAIGAVSERDFHRFFMKSNQM